MIDLKDRLDLAMDIADSLKASNTLSGNTIYDLCLHISKAQELVKNLTIPDVVGMFNEGFTINIKPHPYLQKRGEATLLVHPDDMPK